MVTHSTPPLFLGPPIVALTLLLSACDGPPEPLEATPTEPAVQPRSSDPQRSCAGVELAVCEDGWAGASCDHACSPGFDTCSLQRLCHADGRTHGVTARGTRLFDVPSPDPDPDQVMTLLALWISQHEADLGLMDGLSPGLLRLEPMDGSHAWHGHLAVYRYAQHYDTGDRRALVVGDGSIITVEVAPHGVVAVKGTVVDPRTPFAHAQAPAPIDAARRSIQQHVAVQAGVLESEVTVDDLGLVAVPGADVIAWQGVARVGGQVPVGTVLVEADPQTASGVLPLLRLEAHTANGLHDVVDVQVVSEDLGSDITVPPILEAPTSSLLDGTVLRGSVHDLSGLPQLATNGVVALDVLGNALDQIKDATDVARYTDAMADFDDTQPSPAFDGQRHYHLSQEGYALVDHLVSGSWDSALALFPKTMIDPADPTQEIKVPRVSDYAPGSYLPRIIDANEHAPLGGVSGQAQYGLIEAAEPVDELYQSPGPGLQSEVLAFVKLPPGSTKASILMHELGHAFDVFLGPGFPKTFAPPPCSPIACDVTCDEDTSDEALPLTESIAQMFTLWQLQRIGGVPHDDCGVIDLVTTGAGQGSTDVHHPACMGPQGDHISLFLRDDDPACFDVHYCDKPSANETDPGIGGPHLCDTTAGYNVTSLLQWWWNTLHGHYCEPTTPFSCEPLPEVAWPVGCDAPGSTTPCATPDELAAMPFLYALRTNPLSYRDLIDEMAAFVACNYGEEAYTWFNQALCDHHLRGCGEPMPMMCQSCGNGIREGSEQCDGADMGQPFGSAPTCEDQGFEGGVLACDPITCTYDVGMCIGGASTGGSSTGDDAEGLDETAGDGGGATSWADTEDTVGQGGVDTEDGCSCRSSGGGGSASWLLGAVLLGLRRRRTRRSRVARSMTMAACGLLALPLASACAAPPDEIEDEGEGAGDSSGSDDGESAGDAQATAASDGSSDAMDEPQWPEDSFGPYFLDTGFPKTPNHYLGVLMNFELRPDVLVVHYVGCTGEETVDQMPVSFDGRQAHVRPVDGEQWVDWNGGPVAREIVIRPGDGCEELTVEFIEPINEEGSFASTWSLRRGAVYVTDTCGEDDSIWGADVSPDVPTTCGSAG